MFIKSWYVDVFTVIIFSFIIRIKKLITDLFKRLIYELQNNLHQLTIHISTLIMWHNRFSENKKRGRGDTYTTKSRFQDQKATTSRFQGWKTTTSRFQDLNATTSTFRGILTLMPPDSYQYLFPFIFTCTFILTKFRCR